MFISSGYSAQTRSCEARGSATEEHHLTADILAGAGDLGAPGRLEAFRLGLVFQLLGGEPVEPDSVLAAGPLAGAADTFAPAHQHEAVALLAHRRGLARVHHPVDLGDVG